MTVICDHNKELEGNKMLKLKKLYNLLNRNVKLNIVNPKHSTVYFYGSVKDIPDEYDNYTVVDINAFSNFEYEIIITK